MTVAEGGAGWLGDPKRVVGNQVSVPVVPDSCEEKRERNDHGRQQRCGSAHSEHVGGQGCWRKALPAL